MSVSVHDHQESQGSQPGQVMETYPCSSRPYLNMAGAEPTVSDPSPSPESNALHSRIRSFTGNFKSIKKFIIHFLINVKDFPLKTK